MRQIFFRVSAGLIAVLFVLALLVGAAKDVSLYKLVPVCVVMLAFFLYSIAGDRGADAVLGLMFGLRSENNGTTSEIDAADASRDDSSPTNGD